MVLRRDKGGERKKEERERMSTDTKKVLIGRVKRDWKVWRDGKQNRKRERQGREREREMQERTRERLDFERQAGGTERMRELESV